MNVKHPDAFTKAIEQDESPSSPPDRRDHGKAVIDKFGTARAKIQNMITVNVLEIFYPDGKNPSSDTGAQSNNGSDTAEPKVSTSRSDFYWDESGNLRRVIHRIPRGVELDSKTEHKLSVPKLPRRKDGGYYEDETEYPRTEIQEPVYYVPDPPDDASDVLRTAQISDFVKKYGAALKVLYNQYRDKINLAMDTGDYTKIARRLEALKSECDNDAFKRVLQEVCANVENITIRESDLVQLKSILDGYFDGNPVAVDSLIAGNDPAAIERAVQAILQANITAHPWTDEQREAQAQVDIGRMNMGASYLRNEVVKIFEAFLNRKDIERKNAESTITEAEPIPMPMPETSVAEILAQMEIEAAEAKPIPRLLLVYSNPQILSEDTLRKVTNLMPQAVKAACFALACLSQFADLLVSGIPQIMPALV